jgi:hypothetical protein
VSEGGLAFDAFFFPTTHWHTASKAQRFPHFTVTYGDVGWWVESFTHAFSSEINS